VALYSAIGNSPIIIVDIYGFQNYLMPGVIPISNERPVSGAFFESVWDNWLWSDRRAPNDNFMENKRTAPAVEALRERIRQYMEDGKRQLCRDNLVDLPSSLYTGSSSVEANEAILKLERNLRDRAIVEAESKGRDYIVVPYPLEFYHIPQTQTEFISWIGGLEWVLSNLSINRGCCNLEWSIEVKVLDVLGVEAGKYESGGFLRALGGDHVDEKGPRYFQRAQFTVKGVVNCCE
jgi:hypothetical protein